MEQLIKNIAHATILPLAEEVSYQPDQIVSKTLAQNRHHSLTLFAFDKGEEISTHESSGDAMILALDGTGKITIDSPNIYSTPGRQLSCLPKSPMRSLPKNGLKCSSL